MATFNMTRDHVAFPIDVEAMEFSLPLIHAYSIKEEDATIERAATFDADGNIRIIPSPRWWSIKNHLTLMMFFMI